MTQFASLSTEVRNVVNDSLRKVGKNDIMSLDDKPLYLITSLYALRDDANPKVLDILKSYIFNLEEYLTENQLEFLKLQYTDVILACFECYSNKCTIRECKPVVPSRVVDLCLKIAECESTSEIYLPFSRYGEFSHKLTGAYCDGFEPNAQNWAISEILNSATGSRCNIANSFAIENSDKRYDYVFSCPPLGLEKETVPVLINILQKNLKEGGALFTVLPITVCADGNTGFHLRKYAADINASVWVLALPQQVFGVRVKTCLIIIQNDGRANVTLADFSDSKFVSQKDQYGEKEFILNVDSIVEILTNGDERLVWGGKYSDLKGYYSFLPQRYTPLQNLPKLSQGEKYVKLGELIERVELTQVEERSSYPVIGNRELFDDYLNCTISASNSPKSSLETRRVLNKECLLTGYIGGKIKVAKMEQRSNYVTLRHDVFAFVLKTDIITEDFLLRTLLEDFTREQVNKFAIGGVIQRISFQDFCEILIKVPSLEVQKKLCYDDAHDSVKSADLKLQELYEEYRKDIHMKKHAIGQTMANLKNWWKILEKVRTEGNGTLHDSMEFGRFEKVSVKEIFENIEMSLKKLNIQFNKFDSGYGLTKSKIALTEFIEKYIQGNKNPLFRYQYDASTHRCSEDLPEFEFADDLSHGAFTGNYILRKGDPLEYINFPKDALRQIFDNIISNACAHGFAGREESDNIVKIEIENRGSDYIVVISNNGSALHKKINCEEITVYGHTSGDSEKHYGIGGYEIKRLMEEFGGNLEIISQPNEEFPVVYKLIFHDTNITASFSL